MNPALIPVMVAAMDNAYEGITISDAMQPDNPLIYVNKGFLKMTGLTIPEIIGKNCRFLQGNAVRQEAAQKIKEAIQQKKQVQTEIINYRKDGTPFCNRLSITPVFDSEGNTTHFIGIQEDVTALKEKEALAQEVRQQHIISRTTVEAQEKERDALGKELHDNINQILMAAKLMLATGLSNEDMQVEMMRSSAGLLSQAIEEIRMLSRHLVQPKLSEATLELSLKELVKNLQMAVPFKMALEISLNEQQINSTKKLMLYRIVQEQLSNIIKHAKAKQVNICLRQTDELVTLVVQDDGIGFDPDKLSTGIGLRNMQSRVAMENGRVHLTSAHGQGSRLEIGVPV